MSSKRTEILKSMISDCCPEQKKKKLISLCETRWVERHDSVFLFKDILEPILLSLLKIEEESSDSAPKEIAAKLDIKEEIPRVSRLQTAGNNVPDSTEEEEYYRRAVYVPYLDDFCNSLKERFESHKETVASLQHILPEFCTKTDLNSLEAAFNFYKEYLSHKEVVQ
ncbi:hypothetical protein AVEN_30132-1, partial [Araneus ventricosus]